MKFLLFCLLAFSTVISSAQMQIGSDINGEYASDAYGSSVSINYNGKIVASSSIFNYGNGSTAGHVRILKWNGTTWNQMGADINGEAAGDASGSSISLDSAGTTIAIGAIYNNGGASYGGHTRVYSWNGSSWIQKGTDINGEAADDLSGNSVSLSADGNTVAIGARQNGGTGMFAGHTRIYAWNGSAWIQKGNDIDAEAADDRAGSVVRLSSNGNTVAISALRNDGGGIDAGQVRVYLWNGSAWVQKGTDLNGTAIGDQFGAGLSLSGNGNTVAIGSAIHNSSDGHVLVYEWNGSSWIQKGAEIVSEGLTDYFGTSVSLSKDGLLLAVGATLNDGNGTESGHVRVFEWTGSAWSQQGSDIDGESANDQSGYSIGLSGDRNNVVIGAPFNDGSGMDAGQARVYTFCPNTNVSQLASTLISDANGGIYQWLDCNNSLAPMVGETGQSFTALSNGVFAVQITTYGCTDTSACVAMNWFGIENETSDEVTMYPNPSTGIFYFNKPIPDNELVKITDLTGRIVQLCNPITMIDLSDFENGIYFCAWRNKVWRLVKTH